MRRPFRRRRLLGLAAVLTVVACTGSLATGPLPPDAVAIPFEGGDRGIGGLSAIHVYPGGERFIALSDRALRVEGRLIREEGRLVAMAVDRVFRLIDFDGSTLGRFKGDSEGIAVSADGDVYISFEGVARIRIEDRGDGLPQRVAALPFADSLQSNSGLEALAISPDGSLWTLPERSGRMSRPFPVWRLTGESWAIAFEVPRRGGFLAVGADIGPDGRFYLLERQFTGLGFRSRLRRFALDGTGEETLFTSDTGVYDNLEGVSVWRDDEGELRATMISDDNFRFFQRSQIVEIPIPD